MSRKMNETQLHAVHKVIRLMEEEYGRTLSLSEMAEHALYSPYHLNRLFQKVAGITPSLFLSAIRIERAKQLLLDSNLDLATISSYVGFTSVSTFSRQFKKYVGLSPLQFRKNSHHMLDDLERIELINGFKSDSSQECNILSGKVVAPEGFKGIIFLALFSDPIPNGKPVACTINKKPGSYRIKNIPDGTYYLMSIAFSTSANFLHYLLPNKALRGKCDRAVTVQQGKVTSSESDVVLRSPSPEDPPILVSIPYLITNFINKWRENRAI